MGNNVGDNGYIIEDYFRDSGDIPINILFKPEIDYPLIQLRSKDISNVRDRLLEYQEGRCMLCSVKITDKTGVSLDHQHKTKKEPIGLDGGGLIRGVLCRNCNVLEGKIWNSMRRFLQPGNVNERIKWLESLITYYKLPNTNLIHPSESPKEPLVPKRLFNKIRKYHGLNYPKQKPLEYPKSSKWTKKLKTLLKEMEKMEETEINAK